MSANYHREASLRIPLELPPGIFSDGTSHAEGGRWGDGSNVRFNDDGEAETVKGWESLTTDLLTGVCRSVFPWTDNDAVLNVAFGTHSKLQLWQGGALYDITPYGPVTLLGTDPLASTNTSGTVTVTHTAHGLATADNVVVSGAATFNGLDAANLNGTRAITVVDDDSYTFTAGSADTASATGSGGGSTIRITPQVTLPAGQIDGTGSAGYGTGGYGVGGYASPSTADYFPRTWSFAAYGQELIASPRLGTIYNWTNDTGVDAAALTNAPTQVTSVDVSHTDQVFAFGCNEESSGTFNPSCIRHSGVRAKTVWNTAASTTAAEYILPGGARIVRGRFVGSYALVWTQDSLFLGRYVGALTQIWRFDRIARGCGLIGPNAVAIDGNGIAYWIAPDRQFYRYVPGGLPEPIPCPIRNDFADNLAASQGDKIVASTINEQKEVRWDYPDSRDGYENSRYVALKVAGPVAGTWYRGVMARTAMADAGPSSYPCGVTYDGAAYWHEKGATADGGTITAYIETADVKLDDNASMFVKEIWPDFKDQQGAVSITLTHRFKPQGDETVAGPYMVTSDDEKVDVSAKGVYFKIKYSVSSSPAKFRIGVPVFSATPSGRR